MPIRTPAGMVTQTTLADEARLCCVSGRSMVARCSAARSMAASSTSRVPSISQKFCLFSKDSLHSGHRFIFSSLEDEIPIVAHPGAEHSSRSSTADAKYFCLLRAVQRSEIFQARRKWNREYAAVPPELVSIWSLTELGFLLTNLALNKKQEVRQLLHRDQKDHTEKPLRSVLNALECPPSRVCPM